MATRPSLFDIGAKPAWKVYQDTLRSWRPAQEVYGVTGSSREAYTPQISSAPPDLQGIAQRYLETIPEVNIEVDPQKYYEGMMGPIRGELKEQVRGLGQQLQSVAARSGQAYGDLLARYLPEAVKPLGTASAAASAEAEKMGFQAKVAKTELEQRRVQMANEMAKVDATLKQERELFLEKLRAEAAQLDRQIEAQMRMAQLQARTQREAARIQANAEMARARMVAQMEMRAQQFAQAQQNWRTTQQMRLYDKYFSNIAQTKQQQNILDATRLWQNIITRMPQFTQGSAQQQTQGPVQIYMPQPRETVPIRSPSEGRGNLGYW